MKKLILSMVSAILIITSIFPAKAEETKITDFIISGSGTIEDPYILAPNNQFKDNFDAMAREAVNPQIAPATTVDFSGVLVGEAKYNQTYGGIWTYKSGGPSTITNNALRIKGITYNSNKGAAYLNNILNNDTYTSVLVTALADAYCGEKLKTFLIPYMGTTLAGAASLIFSFSFVSFVGSYNDKQLVKNAVSDGDGVLEINYLTSYNGSWYESTCLDVWSDYPNLNLPGTYYGVGNYESRTSHY